METEKGKVKFKKMKEGMMKTEELLHATDVLSAAWSVRDELRQSFISREQFLQVNLSALEAESISKGVTVMLLMGYFPIQTTP